MNKTGLAGLVTVVCLILLLLFLARENPVIYAFQESGNPTGEPTWSLMNPFRDRSPEQAAEALFLRLRTGDCTGALRAIRGMPHETIRTLCEHEAKHPIVTWSLISRKDGQKDVRLLYRAARDPLKDTDSIIWITVQWRNATWQPMTFEAWH